MDSPPTFTTTNNDGKKVLWWLDSETTEYARNKSFFNLYGWIVEEESGRQTRILTQNNVPVYESQVLEEIVVHIDMMALNIDIPKSADPFIRRE